MGIRGDARRCAVGKSQRKQVNDNDEKKRRPLKEPIDQKPQIKNTMKENGTRSECRTSSDPRLPTSLRESPPRKDKRYQGHDTARNSSFEKRYALRRDSRVGLSRLFHNDRHTFRRRRTKGGGKKGFLRTATSVGFTPSHHTCTCVKSLVLLRRLMSYFAQGS